MFVPAITDDRNASSKAAVAVWAREGYYIELYFLLDQNGQIFKLVFLKTRLCTFYRTFLIPPRAKNILSIHNVVVLY